MVLVIGHRGASGYRPEHTLAGFELAARLGADYLEPDLVITRDGQLICRHEPELSHTTDVARHPEFADRHTTKDVDGIPVTGWFAEDFTLEEVRTLRTRERLAHLRRSSAEFNGQFGVPTFEEVLELRHFLTRSLGRPIGVYPETKHPSRSRRLGLPLEPGLMEALDRHGLNHAAAPVFVQSYETSNLQAMRTDGLRTGVVQLLSSAGSPHDHELAGVRLSYLDMVTPRGLDTIAGYANGIGPAKGQVVQRLPDGSLGTASRLVSDAHAAGLVVHPYTFRAENTFLPGSLRRGDNPAEHGKAIEEQKAFLRAGVDGLFTDFPDIAVAARDDAAAVA